MLRYSLKMLALGVSLVIGSALLCSHAYAGEWYGVVNIGSHHFNKDEEACRKCDHNQQNWGFGAEYREGNWGAGIGTYRNSVRNNSIYLLGNYSRSIYQDDGSFVSSVRLGVAAGIVNGYKIGNVHEYMPGGNIFGAFETSSRIGFTLGYIPGTKVKRSEKSKKKYDMPDVVTFQATYHF